MEFAGYTLPGLRAVLFGDEPVEHVSQRSYAYDPLGSLSLQSTHSEQLLEPTADNIAWATPFGVYSPRSHPEQANLPQMRLVHETQPDWWQPALNAGLTGVGSAWDDLRAAGIGYGNYAPHQPMAPAVPVWKLVEPGSGFVLPATFLGQPIQPHERSL